MKDINMENVQVLLRLRKQYHYIFREVMNDV
jgi:hypothetical protein